MKKINLFIASYKRNEVLSETIDFILNSDFKTSCDGKIFVLSNHTSTIIKEKHRDKVKVIRNEGRPDWSNGNLGESWNQAIVHGFKDLKKPQCDFVVCLQNDAIVAKNWCSNLINYHNNFDFIQGKFGDNAMSFNTKHIKKVGLFDERFCSIQFKEADYQIRSCQRNPEKTYIDDIMHGITWNNSPSFDFDIKGHRNINEDIKRRPDDSEQQEIWEKSRGGIFKTYSWNWFCYKWKGTHEQTLHSRDGWCKNWSNNFKKNLPKGQKKEIIRYPYFEKDINQDIYDLRIE